MHPQRDIPSDYDASLEGEAENASALKSETAFRTIGEAATELGLKTHVLRFWETKFPQISPMKRKDGRRFYRPEDMATLRTIQSLLHDRGMTIRGAQKLLKQHGRSPTRLSAALDEATGASVRDLQSKVRDAVEGGAFDAVAPTSGSAERLGRLLTDLTDLKARMDKVRTVS